MSINNNENGAFAPINNEENNGQNPFNMNYGSSNSVPASYQSAELPQQPIQPPVQQPTVGAQNNNVGFSTGNNTNYGMPNQQYQQPNYNANYTNLADGDTIDAGVIFKAIICALFPIIGVIVGFISSTKRNHKKRSKVYFISAAIGCVISLVLSVVLMVNANKYNPKDYQGDSSSYSNYFDYHSYVDEDENDEADNENTTEATTEEATSETTTKAQSSSTSVSASDWYKGQIEIDGITVTFPCSYAEFSNATGYKFSEPSEADTTLESGESTLSVNVKKGDNELALWLTNYGTGEKKYKDCDITLFRCSDYLIRDVDVLFPGNLKVKDKITKEKLIEMFGEPDDEYEYEFSDGFSYEWEKKDNDHIYFFTVDVENGEITELEFSLI